MFFLLHLHPETDPQTSSLLQEDASGRSSSFWRVNGLTPAPNADAIRLAGVLRHMPISYERSRWSRPQVKHLIKGVMSEVRLLG